ncbi:tail fiber domain-containing protein [Burkholderia sp. GbtcB21]|uniref:tail fiber domain-containing protein n=1 Tax=Burkholderia sp. GbtcB21 TaxID=2824766 RepID=UPI001C306969|nr:tail fiber domain-containing protein [Burkholderia sp. GbtcB21]
MALWQWSTIAANNATAGTINWAEGQAPSTVNDSARQMMADVATDLMTDREWLKFGDTPTYVSGTQFTVPTNRTSIYTAGRRIRTFNTGGILYGTITGSAYTSLTTVTVALDSGALDSGLSEVDVGILNPASASLGNLPGLTLNEPGNSTSTLTINAATDAYGANIKLVGNGGTSSTQSKYIIATGGNFQIGNGLRSAAILSIDDPGNLTITGDIRANSDERLKRDWKPVVEDFLERLATIKSGTFHRIDIGEVQAGVSAQDLQKLLPEAVGGASILSVAYGQAALVACVELAKEVMRLRALLEPVK